MQRLTCYQIHEYAPRLVTARPERTWMDMSDRRFAYRCVPLSIANAMGWELLSPARVTAEWNGGRELEDMTVAVDDPAWDGTKLASSHFGQGILTFHTGYLFRTDPGIGIWARGSPNRPKDGVAALDGIIETDWLPFTFTMNWQLTRPGRVVFEAEEPFCFITPFPYRALEAVRPEIVPMAVAPQIKEDYMAWRQARLDFNAGLAAEDPEIVRQGWQKWYVRAGDNPTSTTPSPHHMSKVSLAAPVLRTHFDPVLDHADPMGRGPGEPGSG
ncbi:MAG TPA: DUF6065 family protein [Bryobacteraceae bacterium]